MKSKKGLTNSQLYDIINIENDKAKSLKLGGEGYRYEASDFREKFSNVGLWVQKNLKN